MLPNLHSRHLFPKLLRYTHHYRTRIAMKIIVNCSLYTVILEPDSLPAESSCGAKTAQLTMTLRRLKWRLKCRLKEVREEVRQGQRSEAGSCVRWIGRSVRPTRYLSNRHKSR